MKTGTIAEITVYDARRDKDPPQRLVELIEFLKTKLESIPPQYRNEATVDASDYDGDTHLRIAYERPETAEEIAARAKVEQVNHDHVRSVEIETLHRLKAKYPEAV